MARELQSVCDINPRQRQILQVLWHEGRMSRWEFHQRLKAHPNLIGADVAALLELGLLRECESEPNGPGRPRVPLELDPENWHVIGLAFVRGRVEASRLNLKGEVLGKVRTREAADPQKLVSQAHALLKELLSEKSAAVGISASGFINPVTKTILSRTVISPQNAVSLAGICSDVGDRLLVLENNMHAVAARWLLTQQTTAGEDVLIARFDDGQVGAALLVEGRPNRGCVVSANELGHMRFFADTEECYCGHTGCLERIVSTDFLRRRGGAGTLAERVAQHTGGDEGLRLMIDYLSAALANAVNFVRPHRLVLVSDLIAHGGFTEALLRLVRSRILPQVAPEVKIDLWQAPATQHAETAGWLALASLYREGWETAAMTTESSENPAKLATAG